MSRITKAVVPAAGLGTRLRPLTNYLPKAMLPLGRKPIIHHIIQELLEAGIEEIGIIIRSRYADLMNNYFKHYPEVLCLVDDSRSGPGGALLKAESFVDDNPFITVFADAPLWGKRVDRAVSDLMDTLINHNAEVVLSMYEVPAEEVHKRGVIDFEEKELPVQVSSIVEKPKNSQGLSNWVSACRYALTSKIFSALRSVDKQGKAELQLTDAISYMVENEHSILAIPLPDKIVRHDTGNFKGYFKAWSSQIEKENKNSS